MARRRPVLRNAGAVACLAVLAAGCSGGAVSVDPVAVGASEAAACAELRDALPELVAGLERRPVEEDAYAAAWGSTPVVLRCGVDEPEEFDRYSACQITDGVAWFIPDEQITGAPVDLVMTTIGRSPGVEVSLPAEHFPPADAMVDLAPAIKQTTEKVERCG
ncbi:MAG: DUF3515 domain-containing protein [Nocardioides sp.]